MIETMKNVVFLVFVGLLASCSVHKVVQVPDHELVLADAFSSSGERTINNKWWLEFNDAGLNSAVESLLESNLTLKQSWARLEQARSVAKMAGAGVLPTIDLNGSGNQTRYDSPVLNPVSMTTGDKFDQYSATAVVGYQLDLWKKISNSKKAEVLTFEASQKNLEMTAMTMVSTLVDVWYSIAEQKTVIDLLNAQVDVSEEYLRLVELRSVKGLASAMEVLQQRLQVESIRNQMPYAELKMNVLKNQLAVLLGVVPGKLKHSPEGFLPELPVFPDTGVPAEILRNRPDVKAAELILVSADHRLASAMADRLPSISLGLSFGDQAADTSSLFDNWFLSFNANILAPLFDGGRRKNEVKRNRAVVYEKVYAWKYSILNALKEVEDTVVTEQKTLKGHDILVKQVSLAEKTLVQSRSRYINGLSDYLNVLTSLNTFHQLSREEIKVRKELLSNRVKLYLALGGSWGEFLYEKGEKINKDFKLKEISNE